MLGLTFIYVILQIMYKGSKNSSLNTRFTKNMFESIIEAVGISKELN
jgi:hypothetical protein